jgi:hypothetical protein
VSGPREAGSGKPPSNATAASLIAIMPRMRICGAMYQKPRYRTRRARRTAPAPHHAKAASGVHENTAK